MSKKKEELIEKIKKYQEKVKSAREKLEMMNEKIDSGNVFRVSYSQKRKTWRIYVYWPDGKDPVTGKTKIGMIDLGVTSSKETAEFTMKVLRSVETEKVISVVLDLITKNESGIKVEAV